MSATSTHWLGNRVHLQPIEGTELTVMQWCRPYHGTLRGARVLDHEQLDRARRAVERAATGFHEHLRLDDLAGRPLDLGSLLVELDIAS